MCIVGKIYTLHYWCDETKHSYFISQKIGYSLQWNQMCMFKYFQMYCNPCDTLQCCSVSLRGVIVYDYPFYQVLGRSITYMQYISVQNSDLYVYLKWRGSSFLRITLVWLLYRSLATCIQLGAYASHTLEHRQYRIITSHHVANIFMDVLYPVAHDAFHHCYVIMYRGSSKVSTDGGQQDHLLLRGGPRWVEQFTNSSTTFDHDINTINVDCK